MSEHDDEYEAQRARGFADRIQAAGVRHAAMKRAATAPTGTPEAAAAAVDARAGVDLWPTVASHEPAQAATPEVPGE